ncbi:heavy metal translocating P-type ATPase [Asticcacaulis sp. BYS171W]|uniref:Heavy metal translocating P-type ATPase n=1 Tax=Asticcacaulis aquaticus TaxID=2984212 RepID=A0ABT5HYW8_9CAUL|nr:heavy metal translocating P-type ATPase [Asticcacaulis aquaticus]MDC7685272.1 heavy metal translocating P-type ATPase [Asticcacaulis aquaticus]
MTDFACYATQGDDGRASLFLQVEGMRCAACAWKIESALNAEPGVEARITYSTQRLKIVWDHMGEATKARANELAELIERLGFSVAPFDLTTKAAGQQEETQFILRCLAVAGFATTYVMLFSDALWFSSEAALSGATRDLMHWAMALGALPAMLYAGRPFYISALTALQHGRANMDVPIAIAVLLAGGMSLYETISHGRYVYYDASVMLLFFLLIGRFLDLKARGKAREAADGLLAMLDGTATVVDGGQIRSVRIAELTPGMILRITAGEKIAADSTVIGGASDIDTSLITGETLPRTVQYGHRLYAGTINLSAPIDARVDAASGDSLLSEVVRLMETAEQGQARYVRIADRVAAIYAPAVHVLAALTFFGWLWIARTPWEDGLMKAMAVLIVTCPCALGLAVPVAQVLASGQLFKRGILVKSGKGLEALAAVNTVVLDKTGTVTLGKPEWNNRHALTREDRRIAVAMAASSRHPLSVAIAVTRVGGDALKLKVEEVPGYGLRAIVGTEVVRMGKAAWIGVPGSHDHGLDLWFRRGHGVATRLTFEDALRPDATATVQALKTKGIRVVMLSGDRDSVVRHVAAELGIDDARSDLNPAEKLRVIEALQAEGRCVLMVGDGLNDAAALSAASVSMSPSTGLDITQNAADLIFRGRELGAVVSALDTARRTQRIVEQNFVMALGYNLIAVPLAVAGLVSPMIAAIAMSSSSLLVILNAFRIVRREQLPNRGTPVGDA